MNCFFHKRTKIITCLLGFAVAAIFSPKVKAQAPFAQINQTPLLFNSSLAGSKGKPRISAGYNNGGTMNGRNRDIYVSTDLVLKKLGTGIGAYYLSSENLLNGIEEHWKNELPGNLVTSGYQLEKTQNTAGLSIAPKLNIMSRLNPNRIKYTFSPSIFMEYSREETKIHDHFWTKEYGFTEYNMDHPEGLIHEDSVVSGFFKNHIKGEKFSTGLGFQLNSKNAIVLLNCSYELNGFSELPAQFRHNSGSGKTTAVSTSREGQLHAMEQSISAGISFPKAPHAKFYFTPIAGIGFRQYLNLRYMNTAEGHTFNEDVLAEMYKAGISYLHGSANFRLRRFLFGAAYTKFHRQDYFGLGLGFQTPSLKLMSNWQFGQVSFHELTLTYTINSL